ncbi:hypothetical protein CTAYLR_010613 [Chrysophaeum taylorii]|uniref:DM2 domain-containing protein n=1 Tax=Chrysophaeum taylorii TaxID=2483200 RepID=A0AAD7UHJ1_9STRA|nr:hypothetical protein CTAYLR_010613 [Chrysophaeum taylorii]
MVEEALRRSEARRSVRRIAWVGAGPSAAGTLRLFVDHCKVRSNDNRKSSRGEVYWELRVEGRLIDDGVDVAGDIGAARRADELHRRGSLASFVERVEIFVDRKGNPKPVVWVPPPGICDGICVRRASRNKVSHVRICVFRKCYPKRFKTSGPLRKVVKGYRDDMSREAILTAISRYADRHKLRQQDMRIVTCDADLKACFGVDAFHFSQLGDMLDPHLEDPDPVVFDYTIAAGDTIQARAHHPKFVDVLVDVPLSRDDDVQQSASSSGVDGDRRARDLETICLDALARAAPKRKLTPPMPAAHTALRAALHLTT